MVRVDEGTTRWESALLIGAGVFGTLSLAWALDTLININDISPRGLLARLIVIGVVFIGSAWVAVRQFRYRLVLVRETHLRKYAERERDFWQRKALEAANETIYARVGGTVEEEPGRDGGGQAGTAQAGAAKPVNGKKKRAPGAGSGGKVGQPSGGGGTTAVVSVRHPQRGHSSPKDSGAAQRGGGQAGGPGPDAPLSGHGARGVSH